MYITHKDIIEGGVMEFVMSASPNKSRGQAKADKPYSLTEK
jgi:putative alpha-1,2-mannosidase